MEKRVGFLEEKDFDKLMVSFLLAEPFFASIMRFVHKRCTFDPKMPTAAIAFEGDWFTLYWNVDFIAGLTKKQFFGLLQHECYHIIFRHLTTRMQEPRILWNIATDLAINSLIPRDELPEGALIPGFFLNELISEDMLQHTEREKNVSGFLAWLPKEKSAEWYMKEMQSHVEQENDLIRYFEGTDFGFDVHLFHEAIMTDTEREFIEAQLKKRIGDAAIRAERTNGWGSVSKELQKKILDSLNDAVNWKRALHYFCGTKQNARHSKTFRRIHRKYPYIHPGTKIKRTSNLVIYIDQSGSMKDSSLSAFFGSLHVLAREIGFVVYHFDSVVDEQSKYMWKKNQSYRHPMRTSAGGTSFQAVELHFRSISQQYDGYIIMTDGVAEKPETSVSKRAWVLLPGCSLDFTPDKRDVVINMTE